MEYYRYVKLDVKVMLRF